MLRTPVHLGASSPHAAAALGEAMGRFPIGSPTQPQPERLLGPGQRRATILVVDDDLDGQELLGFLLRQERYQVHTGDDGLQCLELARALRPDLILLNLLMPGMDGLTALRRLKRDPDLSDLKVVMFSAMRDIDRFEETVLDLGAFACLQSPVHAQALLDTVDKALRS